MDRNTVALEMAKALLPEWNEYTKIELLMEDAFRAADAFIEQARQNGESPENSPASPVQQLHALVEQAEAGVNECRTGMALAALKELREQLRAGGA